MTIRNTLRTHLTTRDDAVWHSEGVGSLIRFNTGRLFRYAIDLRLAAQKEMGEEGRVLSESEREALAEELFELAPGERLARLRDLRRRHGPHYGAMAKELAGEIDGATARLAQYAEYPRLAALLARGMQKALDNGPADPKGALVAALPFIADDTNGAQRFDHGALGTKYHAGQLFTLPDGSQVLYDGDALVPVMGETGKGVGSGLPGRSGSALRGAAQEFVGQFAAIPEGMAISEGAVYQGVLGVFNQIDAGEKPDLSMISGWAEGMDLFRRYLQGNRADRDSLYAEIEGIARGVIGSDLYQAGQWIREETRKALPTNPEYEDEPQQKLARAGGSFAAFVAGGAAGRTVRIPATLITVTMGGNSNASVMFQDAIVNGADWEEAYRAAQLGAGAGLTEAIPIARLFGRIDRGAGGSLRRAVIEAAKGGTEEALQEGFQAIVNNLIASDAVRYDPERQLFEGVGENAGISFTIGGLANFIAVAAGVRRRPTGPMDAPQHPTAPQRDGQGAEMAPEDMGNAPSGKVGVENDVSEAGGLRPVDPDVSVAGTPRDRARRDGYYESALHPNFREESPKMAGDGQAGRTAFGLIDPASGKPVIQPFNNTDRMLALAGESVGPLGRQLGDLVADLPGVEFSSARTKKPDRLGQKLAGDRRPDTLTDYLGGRIVVDDPRMFDEAVRTLTKRYKNVEVDDFLENPRKIGYRAIHMQIVIENGMTAEIQVMPREILEVYKVEHPYYVKWRDKVDLTPEEFRQKEADETRARKAYEDAFERWLRRGNKEFPWRKNR